MSASSPSGADPGAHDPEGMDLARKIAARASGEPERLRKRPAPRRPGDLEPVGEVLAQFIDAAGWSTRIGVANLAGRWPDLVGPANAAHCAPEAYEDRVLTIRAESTAWATSLRQIAPSVVAALNRKLGDGSVTRIVVVGPQAPSWKRRRSVPGRGPRDTYG